MEKGTWRLKTREKVEATLDIKDQWGTRERVARREVNQAEKILGVYQAPNNNGKEQTCLLYTSDAADE